MNDDLLARLAGHLDDFDQRITALENARPRGASIADDTGDAYPQVEAFARWVTWLRRHYELHDAVVECWWRHWAVVEELHALWLSWEATFVDEADGPHGPVIWHERFERTLNRLKQRWNTGRCAGGHQEPPQRPVSDPTETTDRSDYRARFARLTATRTGVRPDAADGQK